MISDFRSSCDFPVSDGAAAAAKKLTDFRSFAVVLLMLFTGRGDKAHRDIAKLSEALTAQFSLPGSSAGPSADKESNGTLTPLVLSKLMAHAEKDIWGQGEASHRGEALHRGCAALLEAAGMCLCPQQSGLLSPNLPGADRLAEMLESASTK
jgi:hypothetical protein